MKGPTLKRPIKIAIFIGILLMLFSLFYMYFSKDVAELENNYPYIKSHSLDSIEYEIKPGRPKHWVSLSEISPYGKWAIVLSEDWAFYQHEGIDSNQIKVAVNDGLKGKRLRGASTITQQMVKNVYLSGSQTIWRKLHEMVLTWKAEKYLSKNRILEVYFNSIEYGPDIYGIKAASKYYFGKSPSQLSPREGAFLAMLLPSPKRYHVSFKKKRLTRFAQIRLKAILTKLRMGKVISMDTYQSELDRKFSWEN